MKCGVGHCGHCYVNHRYVCTDGPVFTLAELRGLPDARVESGLARLTAGPRRVMARRAFRRR